ncbi:hypothetical protein HDU67_008422, partial [Dinochytrium kinnereticum]
KNWCSNYFYGCADCLSKSFCSYCDGQCEVDRSALSLPFLNALPVSSLPAINATGTCLAKPKNSNVTSVCPRAIELEMSNRVINSVEGSGYVDYVINVDLPDFDLAFTLQQLNKTDLPLTLTILSIRPRGSVSINASGTLTLPSRDARRYSGPYYIRIQNAQPNQRIAFALSVTTQQPSAFPIDFINGRGEVLDVTTFVTIFVLSLFVCLSLTFLIKRARDQLAFARGMQGGDGGVAGKEPPPLFRVLLDFPGSIFGGKGGLEVVRSRQSTIRPGREEKEKEKKIPESNRRSFPILRSRFVDEVSSESSNIPISGELINLQKDKKVVAINYLMVFPGCEASLKQGELPKLAVATQLADCSAARFPAPPKMETEPKTGWGRWKERWFKRRNAAR